MFGRPCLAGNIDSGSAAEPATIWRDMRFALRLTGKAPASRGLQKQNLKNVVLIPPRPKTLLLPPFQPRLPGCLELLVKLGHVLIEYFSRTRAQIQKRFVGIFRGLDDLAGWSGVTLARSPMCRSSRPEPRPLLPAGLAPGPPRFPRRPPPATGSPTMAAALLSKAVNASVSAPLGTRP